MVESILYQFIIPLLYSWQRAPMITFPASLTGWMICWQSLAAAIYNSTLPTEARLCKESASFGRWIQRLGFTISKLPPILYFSWAQSQNCPKWHKNQQPDYCPKLHACTLNYITFFFFKSSSKISSQLHGNSIF
jgi:hypothetical protein